MNADISKTIKDRALKFRSLVRSASLLREYAHSDAQKPPKPVAPSIFILDHKF